MYAFVLQFLLFASTYAQMIIFTMPSMETAGALSTLLFTMTLQFNGVLQTPTALPGFWIFMWRVSPFTYVSHDCVDVAIHVFADLISCS